MSLVTVGIILVGWAWIIAFAAAFQIVVDWLAARDASVSERAAWMRAFVRRVR